MQLFVMLSVGESVRSGLEVATDNVDIWWGFEAEYIYRVPIGL